MWHGLHLWVFQSCSCRMNLFQAWRSNLWFSMVRFSMYSGECLNEDEPASGDFHQVSISSTFFACALHPNVFFSSYVLATKSTFVQKSAHKKCWWNWSQAVVFQNSNTMTMTRQLQVVQRTRDQVLVSRPLGLGKLGKVKYSHRYPKNSLILLWLSRTWHNRYSP